MGASVWKALRSASGAVVLGSFACGGQSVTTGGDESRRDPGNGGASTAGTGGASAAGGGTSSGTGGSSRSTGGSSTGRGGSSAGTSGTAGSGATGGGTQACTDTITATPDTNYSLSTMLSFPVVRVRPETELRFSWGGVTKDLLGHALDARSDIDMMQVMVWDLTPEEAATKIRDGYVRSEDLSAIATLYTEKMRTAGTLFELTNGGEPILPEELLPFFDAEAYPPERHSYSVSLASGVEINSRGMRMLQFFTLDPASTNTLVEVTDDSTRLDYAVSLSARSPTLVPAFNPSVAIDWTDLLLDARGYETYWENISEVVVARYTESVGELEARFLDLELIAEDTWRAEVPSGSTLSLSSLTNAAGQPFPGIDENGTWLVALLCWYCLNPAPSFMTVLSPCP